MPRRPLLPLAALLGALALAVAGCSAPDDGLLDTQPGDPSPVCLVHQKQPPGSRYTAGKQADPQSVRELLRYYTANGTKGFCDGREPTGTDRRWTDLYRRLGAASRHAAGR